MPTAIWNGAVIAEAADDAVRIVENKVYFPLSAVNQAYLQRSSHHSECPWKGTAHYYHLTVGGKFNDNAAWYYPAPYEAASEIAGHVAFWRGVEVRR
ncbi:uncharacterized protein (DUF427 family) [Janthinobacterium sp. CG_23.3]|uniref:DUF427 domain-containing protein n=1 Tax=unclassified Janthinobacterium TaxID=2610881 RepID=UPI00034970D1|nr:MULTISPECIES: DUF427 domain-containing protein [unclassified Janthinobacterium]MEC5159721.1 uncharacterized protein (DUF427 family) [Janthinobacterium sp. CG_S6]